MNLTVLGVDLIRTTNNMVTLNTYFLLAVVAAGIAWKFYKRRGGSR